MIYLYMQLVYHSSNGLQSLLSTNDLHPATLNVIKGLDIEAQGVYGNMCKIETSLVWYWKDFFFSRSVNGIFWFFVVINWNTVLNIVANDFSGPSFLFMSMEETCQHYTFEARVGKITSPKLLFQFSNRRILSITYMYVWQMFIYIKVLMF